MAALEDRDRATDGRDRRAASTAWRGAPADPAPTGSAVVEATPADLREVNERLLLAGLRQQDQAAEARRLAEAIEYRALHDALTDLPNRALFTDRLGQTLLAAQRERATFALLFLDLDRFKAINDRLGRRAGDLLLQQIAARLRGALRASDTLARLYGDEFAVLLPGDDAAAAEGVAQKFLRALAPPCLLYGEPERVEVSIGIAVYPAHGPVADALMEQADAAMYTAKRTRSGYAIAGFIEEQQHPHPTGAGPQDGATAAAGPPPAGIAPAGPAHEELRAVNERLLLAGMREHDLADQLRRQLAFTSAITDSLGEGVCAIDGDCRITFVNPAAARLLGWAEADLLGREWGDVAHGQCAAGCPLLAAVGASDSACSGEDVFARRDGTPLPVAYSAARIVAEGRMVGAVVAFRDSTERRRAEAERAALLTQVEGALAFRTRFLSVTAHELKTPLTVLKGYAQLLLRQAQREGDDRLLGSLTRINGQVDRMTRLIDDLGDVARIESGGFALDRRPVELRPLVEETVAEVGMASPDFALRLDARAPDARVHGDPVRLQQVLINLLTNAVKYSARRREVAIGLRREGDRALVTVTDYGIGIPAAQRERVFEPYFRAANAAGDAASGQGLGLFISKAIVDRHGGTLDVVSEEGRGSTFTLTLPL